MKKWRKYYYEVNIFFNIPCKGRYSDTDSFSQISRKLSETTDYMYRNKLLWIRNNSKLVHRAQNHLIADVTVNAEHNGVTAYLHIFATSTDLIFQRCSVIL